MKSERRHHLERNELADKLGSGIESMHGVFPYLLGGIAILVVGFVAWGAYSASSKRKASAAWTDFYFNLAGGDADAFVDLAQDYPKSVAAGWARQLAGDNYLQRGLETVYRNKAEGEKLISQAIGEFEGVLETARNEELRVRAQFGLAQAHESLAEVDQAAGYYEKVAQSTALPALSKEAAERLQYLATNTGKEFYAWFAEQDPQPDAPIELSEDLSLPPSGPEGMQFAPTPETEGALDPNTLPDLPQLDLGPTGDIEATRSLEEGEAAEAPASDAAANDTAGDEAASAASEPEQAPAGATADPASPAIEEE